MKRQLNFGDSTSPSPQAFEDHKKRFEHGHGLRKGKRKLARPFAAKKFLHITLRSKKAIGPWSFLRSKNEKIVQKLIYLYAQRFDVKIYRFANSGNHLHILLKAPTKEVFQNFLRVL